jgi:hypothetical protein
MKLAMSKELEDPRFGFKQTVDLKYLSDDQHHEFEVMKFDITDIS